MLVLSRKKNDEIVITGPGIEGEIVLMVVEIRGDKVRLGVEAPQEVLINRREVHDAINGKIGGAACSLDNSVKGE